MSKLLYTFFVILLLLLFVWVEEKLQVSDRPRINSPSRSLNQKIFGEIRQESEVYMQTAGIRG